ncbi:MAG: hypothetical protein A2Y17_03450 [Clostridiales bacterium GWF2_38_85]|nr:MAG: hypothetical protein A2Y17_03450 [Clostridiales bacterium GWF2_38_85]HBL85263.1 hypothetical protein [Clostridiales bacterium]
MSKSNKELTIEVVNSFMQSWSIKNNTLAIQSDQLIELIKKVNRTICNLDIPNECNENDKVEFSEFVKKHKSEINR